MSNQDNRGGVVEPKPKAGIGKRIGIGCLGIAAVIVVLAIIGSMLGPASKTGAPSAAPADSSTAAASSASASSASATPPAATNWVYTASADAMNDKETKEACTTSTNQVSQKFPYHDTTAQLCVRQSPKYGLDAYVKLDDDGQILCEIEGCNLPVRFDKQPTQNFAATGSSDNATNIIFIKRSSTLITALKKSSSTAVEVTLFQNGDQPLTFNTAGLKWP